MLTCSSCQQANPDLARFCLACGSSLQTQDVGESRRLVTIVFCDLENSTPLASRLDAESFRKIVTRYFDELRVVLERHGGTVEKFIGDAVMAVFGVPSLHEDDALRAVRAAQEMHDALGRLNDELERDWGVRLQHRIGVNSGEVVAGDPFGGQAFVSGEPVNLASRLEDAAQPGTILLGEDTYRLVRDAVTTGEVELLHLKGIGDVRAHRLIDVIPGAAGHARRHDSPLVDRERETALLRDAFERMLVGRQCQMVTLLGAAGVGKSRLVDEFLRWTDDRATTYRGRCLAYGEGITFWPIVEVVTQAAGLSDGDTKAEARAKIAGLVSAEGDDPNIAQRVSQAIGVGGSPGSPEETFWAIRAFFEALARRRPVVLVFDDIQWGEPTMLELLEHIADWSRDVPIMLLCLARPDLLESHRAWGGGKLNAASLLLEPLTGADSDVLVRNLLGTAELATYGRERIIEAAEGNPLFVEEILSMLIDDGRLIRMEDRWMPSDDLTTVAIPPTIAALLAARLDRLQTSERTLIERASVVGKDFSAEALGALIPEELVAKMEEGLTSLVRKDLIRPGSSRDPGGAEYSYRHILIRDAAYESLPKHQRAELHERFAAWLPERHGDRIEEFDEILGYHLEQSHRYLGELGPLDDRAGALGIRAGARLAAAGRRALARGDMQASANLLGRAAALLPHDAPERLSLLPDLAESFHSTSDLDQCISCLDELIVLARRANDLSLETWAGLRRAELGFLTDPRGTEIEGLRALVRSAIETFERLGEDGRLASALMVGSLVSWLSGAAGAMLTAAERALDLARPAGDWGNIAGAAGLVGRALVLGNTTCSDALVRLEALVDELEGDRIAQASCRLELALILAMLGRAEEAMLHVERSHTIFEDLGLRRWLAQATETAGVVEWSRGRLDEAERKIRASYSFFRQQNDALNSTPAAADLALVLCDLGRFEEAGALANEVAKGAAIYDLEPQVGWRSVRARVLASRGRSDEAEALAREAVQLLEPTEFVDLQADSLVHLAEVLRSAERHDEAAAALGSAIDGYRRKGDRALERRTMALAEAYRH